MSSPIKIDRILESHADWALNAKRYQRALFALGFIAVTSSVLIAGFTKELGDFWVRVLAASSALSTGYLGYFQVQRKISDYWKGWKHMNAHLALYEEGKIDIVKLAEEYLKAEDFVGVPETKPESPTVSKKR